MPEQLFGTLDVDTFLLEYDDERSGGFEPLRSVPPGKNVVLGLITSKTPVLESVDAVRRRIDEASRYVPLEHLALSTQCGFASIARGNLLSLEDQWRKLELVVETARAVWGEAGGQLNLTKAVRPYQRGDNAAGIGTIMINVSATVQHGRLSLESRSMAGRSSGRGGPLCERFTLS